MSSSSGNPTDSAAQLSAHLQTGLALFQQRQFVAARIQFEATLPLAPNHPEIHKAIGDTFQGEKRLTEALPHWYRAIELKPDYVQAWQNLGLGLEHFDQLDEAITCHHRVTELCPGDSKAHRFLGMSQLDAGQLDAAQASFDRALQLNSNDPENRWQKFFLMALRGEFPQAWAEYEYRFKIPGRTTPERHFQKPKWRGEPLRGKTLFLHAEQGFGDTIQAVRYAPLLADQGARVLLGCPPPLVALLRTVCGVAEILAEIPADLAFDFHLPLMSLPGVLGTTLETAPCDVPYLAAPAEARVSLPANAEARVKIGLVWSGSHSQPIDRRSVPLMELRPLLDVPGVAFYSLQVGEAAADLEACGFGDCITNLAPQLKDFAATAAAIAQLDLVVTVDTSVAHLAGALGKPTWLLLSFAPDWRWLRDREASPWYPSMRLFRQTRAGGWAEVAQRIADELTRRASP